MPKRKRRELNWDDVRRFLVTLPGVEYQPPGPGVFPRGVVRANRKPLAYPVHRRVREETGEQGNLVWIRTSAVERPALLAGDPEAFFVTPHFATSPGVIVRLDKVDEQHLRELLTEGWRTVASKRMVAELEQA